MALPTGTVTFLFTDIEGSTRLLQEHRDRYPDVLKTHRQLLRATTEHADGYEFETQGDGLFTAFPSASDALKAAVTAQRALHEYHWPEGATVRVRMGLHTGQPTLTESGYVGLDLHRTARICTAGHGGQILLSQTTRELVEDDLPESVALRDLGEHRLKDLTRPQRLFQVMVADLPSDFPPLRSLDVVPNNLPIQLTSFIGREQQIADVKRLLGTARLLTLTGAGGSGKTRLALQVAADSIDHHSDGVWLVELAAISDPELVPQAVASALNLREQPGRSYVDVLVDYLRAKQVLLLLDNCEHLVNTCARIADVLLRASSKLKILVTSREGLAIGGETLYPVPTLSLPHSSQGLSVEDLSQYEAIRLFTERAAAALPTFRLLDGNARAVAQVCGRLDGIPLAIEMAASRVKALSVEQIATRLNDQFRLLTGGSRTALPRHQTLLATMDWSFDLLSNRERMLLRRLAPFAGGFTLEAAESVCAYEEVEASDVFDLLSQVVNKSLVVADEQDSEVRYRLLETIRQYARDRLREAGEADLARKRHRDFFVELAARAEPELTGPDEPKWAGMLNMEHDNLRAALGWSLESGDPETALRLAGMLGWFWSERGYLAEGRKWLETALAEATEAAPMAKAKALHRAGWLARLLGDFGRARHLLEASAELYRGISDRNGLAQSLSGLASVGWIQDDGQATILAEESFALAQETGDLWTCGFSLNTQARIAGRRGNYERARALAHQSLTFFRSVGSGRGTVMALNTAGMMAMYSGDLPKATTLLEESCGRCAELGLKDPYAVGALGCVAYQEGDYPKAVALLEECLGLSQELEQEMAVADAAGWLGKAKLAAGDYAQASALLKQSLIGLREIGNKFLTANFLYWLGKLVWIQGDPEKATRLLGATEALRQAASLPLPPVEQPDHEHTVASLRSELTEHQFATVWAEGRAMTLEQAIEYALTEGP